MYVGVTLTKKEAQRFKEFLRQEPAVLDFEPSECYNTIHIEVRTDLTFEELIDRYGEWLEDTLIG